MDKLKYERGITLIALVITIIVLLILAGVTINTLMGEGGIVKQATDAKSTTEKAGLAEEVKTILLGRKISTTKSLQEELEEGISGATITPATGTTDICYVTRNGTTITVYDNGDILEGRTEVWDGISIESPEFKQENLATDIIIQNSMKKAELKYIVKNVRDVPAR